MRVLITGAAGYLGRGLRQPFEREGYTLRLMDIAPFESPHEKFIGDVAQLESVRKAVAGMDAMVIAHMAPRRPDAYVTPVVPFDVNVKGTANLFFAAAQSNVRKVVLISSTGVTVGHSAAASGLEHGHLVGPKSKDMYGLTKVLQEVMAEQFSREYGIGVSVLRVGHIVDQDAMQNKYGRKITTFEFSLTDRRDIGEVARLCLERSDIKYEVFNVMSTDESRSIADVQHTCDFLGWKARYPFAALPKPGAQA
jgi:nucleoside-diphosphate-sugar epimerase